MICEDAAGSPPLRGEGQGQWKFRHAVFRLSWRSPSSSKYGRGIHTQPQLRNAVLCFVLVSFRAAGMPAFLARWSTRTRRSKAARSFISSRENRDERTGKRPPNGFGPAAILAAGIGAFVLAVQVFSAGRRISPFGVELAALEPWTTELVMRIVLADPWLDGICAEGKDVYTLTAFLLRGFSMRLAPAILKAGDGAELEHHVAAAASNLGIINDPVCDPCGVATHFAGGCRS
jgi:hypothetical protein